MRKLCSYCTHAVEGIAALMLAAMFFTFLLQIFSRYVSQTPFGWTLELCLTLWVWIVFFCNATIVRERNHVTFDVIYLASPRRLRQVFSLISAGVVAGVLFWSLLPTWEYIDFLKIRKSATLKIPMREVMIVYMFFLIVVIARYLWRCIRITYQGPPDKDHDIPGHEPDPPALRHGKDAV